MKALWLTGRICVVTDANVLPRWGWPAVESLRAAGFEVTAVELPAGEASKTLQRAEALYGHLIANHFGRHDAVVPVGGGVIGDLAGFVAATYHRGMALVHVPTTLLAQVDSSIGGKVAIDHPLGKNLIGAFYAPHLVLCDVAALETLPARDRWSGLAEVVKGALIADSELFLRLENELEQLGNGTLSQADWVEVIGRAVRIKVDIVSEDEEEDGRRVVLNFGHTLGHALEAAAGYGPLTHGEAIVIGMRTAVEVSLRLHLCPPADASRAQALLARFPAPPPVPPPDAAVVRAALARDKKGVGGNVRFVILSGLGKADVVPSLEGGLLEFAVEHARSQLGASP
jgi:3-dehydroquinate synthase